MRRKNFGRHNEERRTEASSGHRKALFIDSTGDLLCTIQVHSLPVCRFVHCIHVMTPCVLYLTDDRFKVKMPSMFERGQFMALRKAIYRR